MDLVRGEPQRPIEVALYSVCQRLGCLVGLRLCAGELPLQRGRCGALRFLFLLRGLLLTRRLVEDG